jgi:hypothetical protein
MPPIHADLFKRRHNWIGRTDLTAAPDFILMFERMVRVACGCAR